MRTRPIVIHIPVVRFPSWTQILGVTWRLMLLVSILIAGHVVAALWPSQDFLIAFITGNVWAYAFTDMGWRK